jgi:hypothetical protein
LGVVGCLFGWLLLFKGLLLVYDFSIEGIHSSCLTGFSSLGRGNGRRDYEEVVGGDIGRCDCICDFKYSGVSSLSRGEKPRDLLVRNGDGGGPTMKKVSFLILFCLACNLFSPVKPNSQSPPDPPATQPPQVAANPTEPPPGPAPTTAPETPPDTRVYTDPLEDFLLEEEDLKGLYYIPDESGWEGLTTNQDILNIRELADAQSYIDATGRVEGQYRCFHKSYERATVPLELCFYIVRFETAQGASLAMTPEWDSYRVGEEIIITDVPPIGDESNALHYPPEPGEEAVEYYVTFRVRNIFVDILGFGLEENIDINNLVGYGRKVFDKINDGTLSESNDAPTTAPDPATDTRVITGHPKDYQLEVGDLDGLYYTDPEWDFSRTNAEIVEDQGQDVGNRYLLDTGRIDGYVRCFHRVNDTITAPLELCAYITFFQTAEGASFAFSSEVENESLNNPQASTVSLPTIGDESIILLFEQRSSTGEMEAEYYVNFRVRNVVVYVFGFGLIEDVDVDYLVDIAGKVLDKLNSGPLSK